MQFELRPSPPIWVGVPTSPKNRVPRGSIGTMMSPDDETPTTPEVPRKFVVGLFCGAAFHDVRFARLGECEVVRLYDWESRMRRLAGAGFFSPFIFPLRFSHFS